jgi:hypothetical protein
MGLLTKVLEENGRQAPESRLDTNEYYSNKSFAYFIID